MKVFSLFAVLSQLALGVVFVASQDPEQACDGAEGPPCDETAVAENPDVGSNVWPHSGQGPVSRCGPGCERCRFSFCVRCEEGFQLILAKCMLNLNFDDLTPSTAGDAVFRIRGSYRGFDFTNFRVMNPVLRGNGRNTSGFGFGTTSSPHVVFNKDGDSVTMQTLIGAPFSVYSLQITPAWCTPLIVVFRGEFFDGGNIFYSEVLEFDPNFPGSHINTVNLFARGFIGITLLEIITFEYPNSSCPYRPNGNPEIVSMDDMLVFPFYVI